LHICANSKIDFIEENRRIGEEKKKEKRKRGKRRKRE